jgi:hypothetical protein
MTRATVFVYLFEFCLFEIIDAVGLISDVFSSSFKNTLFQVPWKMSAIV